MPLLGLLMTGIIRILLSVFGRFISAEKAFNLAAMVIILGLGVALLASMNSCVTGVCAAGIANISSSHQNFAVGLGLIFNSVTLAAVSGYMAIWIACQVYVMKKKMFEVLK